MLTGIRYIQQPEALRVMNTALPILFIAGGEDPVGGYGKGVLQTAKAFEKVGMTDVACKLYPLCRHEILNEINKDEVFRDILNWIEKII
jgi:alpha-beta hydrolase superfamily lysophospholipase